MKIQKELPLLEEILGAREEMIGAQYMPYKNHVYRVLQFCFAFHECKGDDAEKLIIAGCFHDLGMWPNDTVDYLEPSIVLVQKYLAETGRAAWSEEISMMIDLHHRFRSAAHFPFALVDVFRKGDWVDASLGLRSFGLPKAYIREVQAAFPNLGFHDNLLRLAKDELFKYGRNPLPMMRW